MAGFIYCHRAMLLATLLCSASTLRLDAALVARGLCASRGAAKSAVQAGHVLVDGAIVRKASFALGDDAEVALADAVQPRYVSRAGLKLEAALSAFGLDLSGAAVLDVGASTGGFTDCALQAGAASVVAVDCGHDQLHASLDADERVVSREGVNARSLTADALPRATFDAVVIDVSFISLRLVLPAIWPLLASEAPSARLIALVKPQFEVGRAAVNKGKGARGGRSDVPLAALRHTHTHKYRL
jgi:23S rRNA (cytidine1920-2'-O)/16S rRNA (cytidine1409-2'-O)-methyltransferase